MSTALEEVIYFASYVVTKPGNTPMERKTVLTGKGEYRERRERIRQWNFPSCNGAEH